MTPWFLLLWPISWVIIGFIAGIIDKTLLDQPRSVLIAVLVAAPIIIPLEAYVLGELLGRKLR